MGEHGAWAEEDGYRDCGTAVRVVVWCMGFGEDASHGLPSFSGEGGHPRRVGDHGGGSTDEVEEGGQAAVAAGFRELFDVVDPPAVGLVAAPVGAGGHQGEQALALGAECVEAVDVLSSFVGDVPRALAHREVGDASELPAEGVV